VNAPGKLNGSSDWFFCIKKIIIKAQKLGCMDFESENILLIHLLNFTKEWKNASFNICCYVLDK
jgi:hypothetical protein